MPVEDGLQEFGSKVVKYLSPFNRLLHNSSEFESCLSQTAAPRGYLTINRAWIAMNPCIQSLNMPGVLSTVHQDDYNNEAEEDSLRGPVTHIVYNGWSHALEWPIYLLALQSEVSQREFNHQQTPET